MSISYPSVIFDYKCPGYNIIKLTEVICETHVLILRLKTVRELAFLC